MKADEIAVIIPCYNEEKSIVAVIDEVRSVLPSAQIYVFDNNSTDKSVDLVRAKIAQLSQANSHLNSRLNSQTNSAQFSQANLQTQVNLSHINGGGGGGRPPPPHFHAPSVIAKRKGVASATKYSTKNKIDCHESLCDSHNDDTFTNNPNSSKLHLYSVPTQGKGAVIAYAFSVVEAQSYVMIDADLECDTSILPQALQLFKEQNLDMLNIARTPIDTSIHRKGHSFGNKLFSKSIQILFKKGFKDLFSGYRIFSRAFVKSFPAQSKGFEIETELSVFALQCGLRIGEISAPYRSRLEGSFSKLRTFKDGFKILFMIFSLLFTERPLFVFGTASVFCLVLSLILGVPIVVEFMQTSQVARFPTLFICVGLMVISVVLGIAGLLAHLVGRNCKEMRRFFYLLHKGGGSSLRASEASAAIHGSKIDCHENPADSLAMTENVSNFQNDKI